MTLEELKAEHAALLKLKRSGALSVRHGDKAVQYRSMAELDTALADLASDIAAAEGKKRKRVFYIGAGRGF